MTKALYEENERFVAFVDYDALRYEFGNIIDHIRVDRVSYPFGGPSFERQQHVRKLYNEMINSETEGN